MRGKKDRFIFILNAVWGAVQSGIGLILFLRFINKPHFWYKGSLVTARAVPEPLRFNGGLSLGIFVFVTYDITEEQADGSRLIRHEYGHCLQSALLGPLYIIIVGIPSLIWMAFFSNWRKRRGASYYAFFIESWAQKWGGAEDCS